MPGYMVIHYEENGRDIIKEWLNGLRDIKGKDAIVRAISRLLLGNFGDHKPCRDGVSELRIHAGAGYRVYYSVVGDRIVLLLCGGSKRTQQRDIDKAVEYLRKFKDCFKCSLRTLCGGYCRYTAIMENDSVYKKSEFELLTNSLFYFKNNVRTSFV